MSKNKNNIIENKKLNRYQLERRFLMIGLFSGVFIFHRKPVSVGLPIKGIWGLFKSATSIVWHILKWKLPK